MGSLADFAWFGEEYRKHESGIREKDPQYYWWIPLDRPIFGACIDHPTHSDSCEVYAKVALINRMYSAQLGRGKISKDKAEVQVARALFQSDIDKFIEPLFGLDGLNETVLPEVLKCHDRLVRIVRQGTGKDELSFSSKYLSFHVPRVVPIFDSKASKTARDILKGFFSFRGYGFYEKHCRRILNLMDFLIKGGIKPNLKIIDYVLFTGPST